MRRIRSGSTPPPRIFCMAVGLILVSPRLSNGDPLDKLWSYRTPFGKVARGPPQNGFGFPGGFPLDRSNHGISSNRRAHARLQSRAPLCRAWRCPTSMARISTRSQIGQSFRLRCPTKRDANHVQTMCKPHGNHMKTMWKPCGNHMKTLGLDFAGPGIKRPSGILIPTNPGL